ncbi:hypothetical protein P7K49_014227 [Saguinus oedipus]|uniref:Uncharacterized protein n=1 Tax=Saguinus oedipus TaxID=9490 RepID=A0ABQ9VIL0_SAGOE|nr:hypothetical protein P7K49_014227 [Saguinus oedipus]
MSTGMKPMVIAISETARLASGWSLQMGTCRRKSGAVRWGHKPPDCPAKPTTQGEKLRTVSFLPSSWTSAATSKMVIQAAPMGPWNGCLQDHGLP